MSKASEGMIWAIKNPEKAKDIQDRWGIAPPSHGVKPDAANWEEQTKHNQTYTDQVQEAARNDYDLRETTAAAARSGKNKAIELEQKGFKDIGDVANWMNFSEKAADRHGQGGDFSSISDWMGLTKSMQKRDRRIQTEGYEKMFATTEDLNSVREDLEKQREMVDYRHKPIEKSDELARAEDRVQEYEDNGPISIYGNNNEPASTNNTPRDATASFFMTIGKV